ncbi:unnamed protein product [Calicophoron daubneyi]|uniref:Uncharacterized protein n=1 Tax=Calicophoron daubneyi TaxID=300641 RepID=A0AAV2TIS0_CALDB
MGNDTERPVNVGDQEADGDRDSEENSRKGMAKTNLESVTSESRDASDHGGLVTLKGSDVRFHSQEADWSTRQKKSSAVVRAQSAPSLTSSDPADPSDVVTRQFRSVKAPNQTDLHFPENRPCSSDPKNNCTISIQSLDNVTPSAKSDQYPSRRSQPCSKDYFSWAAQELQERMEIYKIKMEICN